MSRKEKDLLTRAEGLITCDPECGGLFHHLHERCRECPDNIIEELIARIRELEKGRV